MEAKIHNTLWNDRRDKVEIEIFKLKEEDRISFLIKEAEQYGIRDALTDFIFEELGVNPEPKLSEYSKRFITEENIIHETRSLHSESIKKNGGNLLYFMKVYHNDFIAELYKSIPGISERRYYNQIWFLNELCELAEDTCSPSICKDAQVKEGMESYLLDIISFYKEQGLIIEEGNSLKPKTDVWALSLFEVLEVSGIVKNITGNTGSIKNHVERISKVFTLRGNAGSLEKKHCNTRNEHGRFNHKDISTIKSELTEAKLIPA